MEQKESKDELRKLVQSIRRHGSEMNLSLPVDQLRSEAVRIKGFCDQLLAIVGNAD